MEGIYFFPLGKTCRDIGSFIAILVREVHIHSTGDLG